MMLISLSLKRWSISEEVDCIQNYDKETSNGKHFIKPFLFPWQWTTLRQKMALSST
jgi:hypothetical protein